MLNRDLSIQHQKCHSKTILTLIEISCMIAEVVNSCQLNRRLVWWWLKLDLSGTQWTEEPRSDHSMQSSVYLLYLRFLLLNLTSINFYVMARTWRPGCTFDALTILMAEFHPLAVRTMPSRSHFHTVASITNKPFAKLGGRETVCQGWASLWQPLSHNLLWS